MVKMMAIDSRRFFDFDDLNLPTKLSITLGQDESIFVGGNHLIIETDQM